MVVIVEDLGIRDVCEDFGTEGEYCNTVDSNGEEILVEYRSDIVCEAVELVVFTVNVIEVESIVVVSCDANSIDVTAVVNSIVIVVNTGKDSKLRILLKSLKI